VFSLNSANGSVIFQYIKMQTSGAGPVSGGSASIGIRSATNYIFNDYSVNIAGAVLTGDATGGPALQAVAFDRDSDGDRLIDIVETALGTDPANTDTDNGLLDDGAEVAAGTDPLVMGDDVPGADADGDGLQANDEAFYGTDPAKADTDGDGATMTNDGAEIGLLLDPTNPDTDGDGLMDGAEIQGGSDPFNPNSPGNFGVDYTVNGDSKRFPQLTRDANGNLHGVADTAYNRPGLFYYMIGSDGIVKIPEVFLKSPVDDGTDRISHARIATYNGKVYITYEDRQSTGGRLGLMVVDPSLAPQDGTAVEGIAIVTANYFFNFTSYPREHAMAVGASGIHVAFQMRQMLPQQDDQNKFNFGFGYAQISFTGQLLQQRELLRPTRTLSGADNATGLHKSNSVDVTVDADGVAHVIMAARHGRREQNGGGIYYAKIGTQVSGPYYIGSARGDRVSSDLLGDLIVVFQSGGRGPTGSPNSPGSVFAVLDRLHQSIIPRFGDGFGVTQAIDTASFVTPWTLFASQRAVGASVRALPGGKAALLGYHERDNGQFCVVGVAFAGAEIGTRKCISNDTAQGHRSTPIVLRDATSAWTIVRSSSSGSDFRVGLVPMAQFAAASAPAVNYPPAFTSTPPTAAFVGIPLSYGATATDQNDPAGSLVFSLIAGPTGLAVSGTGALTWTPAAGDVGDHAVTIQVCDPAMRCTTQQFTVTVGATSSPVISSTPPTAAIVGKLLQYQIVATDLDGQTSTFSLVSGASGNLAVSTAGALSWTPAVAEVGLHTIKVRATDPSNNYGEQSFVVQVVDASSVTPSTGGAPTFTSVPPTVAIVGRAFSYQAVAVDPVDASAAITYALTSTASGDMALSSSGVLTWKPVSKEKGAVPVAITATGPGGNTVQTFTVTVISEGGGGCSTVGGVDGVAPGLVILALMALAAWRRRRARGV
jgi:hypothetical protein